MNFGSVGTGGWYGATCPVVNHHRITSFLAPLAAAALIFSLAACGSDDDATSDPQGAPLADAAAKPKRRTRKIAEALPSES